MGLQCQDYLLRKRRRWFGHLDGLTLRIMSHSYLDHVDSMIPGCRWGGYGHRGGAFEDTEVLEGVLRENCR
jgi:hypothetical protein